MGLFFKVRHYSTKKSLLKVPKKAELTKHESIKQQENVINRKNQDPIEYVGPHGFNSCWKPIFKERLLYKQNSKPRAGKNDEYDHHLPKALYFPAYL